MYSSLCFNTITNNRAYSSEVERTLDKRNADGSNPSKPK